MSILLSIQIKGNKMLCRILTENKNYQDIVKLVDKYFSGAIIIKADGLWQGQIEHSLVIEISIDHNEQSDIEHLAFAIKKHNEQDAVLVQYLQCESKMV